MSMSMLLDNPLKTTIVILCLESGNNALYPRRYSALQKTKKL